MYKASSEDSCKAKVCVRSMRVDNVGDSLEVYLESFIKFLRKLNCLVYK